MFDDTKDEDAVIVRIYTENTKDLVDTGMMIYTMRAAAEAGCGAEVLASFTNGLVYRFTPGETINPTKYDREEVRRYM